MRTRLSELAILASTPTRSNSTDRFESRLTLTCNRCNAQNNLADASRREGTHLLEAVQTPAMVLPRVHARIVCTRDMCDSFCANADVFSRIEARGSHESKWRKKKFGDAITRARNLSASVRKRCVRFETSKCCLTCDHDPIGVYDG